MGQTSIVENTFLLQTSPPSVDAAVHGTSIAVRLRELQETTADLDIPKI